MTEMDNTPHPANAHKQRCPRCQSPLNTVVVHGHEQCVVCKLTGTFRASNQK